MKINMAEDFSRFPAGRFISDGEFSGEKFRKDFLVPNLKKDEVLEIDLTGLGGVGSSFWDEAFAGLILRENFTYEDLKNKLKFICTDDITLEPLIWQYIKDAKDMIR